MDGSQFRQAPQVDVEEGIRNIKVNMPQTYRSIQAKASEIGREAYALVRRSLAGQRNAFYAIERGHVVGTPFEEVDLVPDVARLMVQFECRSVVMWARSAVQGSDHGAV
jgi:hypothetical protein